MTDRAPRLAAMILFAAALCVTSRPSRAAIEQPDAVFFGRVFARGKLAPLGVLVEARSGTMVLDSFRTGSNPTHLNFYGLRIPVDQIPSDQTAAGEVARGVFEGGKLRLFIDGRSAGEVTVLGGRITRRELTAGVSRCSGGSNDGQSCVQDTECPGGLCVVAQALCSGGSNDGKLCQCIESTCVQESGAAVCSSGAMAGDACDLSMSCPGGTCTATQRVCEAGSHKGAACLSDAHCPGSRCGSTGKVCNGGTKAGQSCADNADCDGGTCGPRTETTPAPTVTRTPTSGGGTPRPTATATVTPTRASATCGGDCNEDGEVTIDELVLMVNIALETRSIGACVAGDANGDRSITIDELIAAVGRALSGCPPDVRSN